MDLTLVLYDDSFWRSFRDALVRRARPLFREVFLVGAALGANEEPAAISAVKSASALGTLIGLAADLPAVELAAILYKAGDYPGVSDFQPEPGPDGLTVLPFDFEAIAAASDQIIDAYTDRWWLALEDTTREGLRRVIRRAADEGLTIEQVMREIEPMFGKTRAQRIAVSEVTNLLGQGAQETYRQAGFGAWIWRTVRDARVDPVCAKLAVDSDPMHGGTPFPMTRQFERAHVGCRCWPVPAGDVIPNAATGAGPSPSFGFP